ncbi:MAG: lysophospholipase [Acidobacteria bacterium]|nr:lysophospholipase [Acidobacteriota bacterium]
MESVTFYSQGSKLVGHLHRNRGANTRGPGVVVVGSWTTVKEQMPSNYAPLMADAGITALTFDFAGFGESEGALRDVESPRRKAEDIRNALLFLRTRAEVDPERAGVLAICASAGYTALAALDEPAVKSIVMVAPWLHDAAIVKEMYGGDAGVADRLAKARAAREHYVKTGTVDYVSAASNSDPTAAMYSSGDALDYYLNPKRGAIPQWGARFAVMAWNEWLEFDPIPTAARINVPLRIVTSEQSATPGGAKQFAAGLRGRHDVVWTSGIQFDFYDSPSSVRFAADRAIEHFKRTLP